MTLDELRQSYQDRLKEYFEFRKVKVSGKLDNPLQLRLVRRNIARIKTVLNERMRERTGKDDATGSKAGKA